MKKFSSAVLLAVVMLCAGGWGGCGSSSSDSGGGGGGTNNPPPFIPPTPSPFGWTVLDPSSDTQTIYVSDSDGSDLDDGLTEATAKKTINAGKALLRSGFPDWMLLKCGDTFTNQTLGGWTKSGRSASEPMVVGSYGVGARPRLLTGDSDGLNAFNTAKAHVYFVGLYFKPHTYTGVEGSTGVKWLCEGDNILFEDCVFEGFKDNFVVQDDNGPITNFRIRRSVIADAWCTSGSNAEGIYASGVDGILIEGCVFDHNGWKEGPGGAAATVFNHNTYMDHCRNIVFRGNLFMRASNLGNKFRSDGTGDSPNILIENNVYIEGAVGISMGGNTSEAGRFSNVTVRQNVLMHIGRTDPNGQGIGWHMTISDWNGGLIEDNLFLYQSMFDDGVGIEFEGQTDHDITINNNLFYALRSRGLRLPVTGSMSDISITNNEFQDPSQMSKLVSHSGVFTGITYQNNKYSSNAAGSAWFSVNNNDRSYAQWLASSGETGSSNSSIAYSDPGRDESTYMASLGQTATMAAFCAEVRAQSRQNWRTEFTAEALIAYVRAGYDR